MSSLTPNVSPLRQRMIDDMRMRQLNGKTQIHYIRAVRRLAAFLKRSPDTATAEDLRAFQLHMVDTGTSPPTIKPLAGLKAQQSLTLPTHVGKSSRLLFRLLFSQGIGTPTQSRSPAISNADVTLCASMRRQPS
jgi:hypothetical protein